MSLVTEKYASNVYQLKATLFIFIQMLVCKWNSIYSDVRETTLFVLFVYSLLKPRYSNLFKCCLLKFKKYSTHFVRCTDVRDDD